MDKRARSFLMLLKDGRWHRKVGTTGVWVAQACVNLKLVSIKFTSIRGKKNHYTANYRITSSGKSALNIGLCPTQSELSHAIRLARYGITF